MARRSSSVNTSNVTTTSTSVVNGKSVTSVSSVNTVSRSSSVSSSYRDSSIIRAFAVLLLLLLVLNLFMSLRGSDNKFTFTRLLQIFGDFEASLDTQIFLKFRIPPISSDWGVANFLRNFFNNVFVAPLNVIFFILGGVAYLIQFCVYFLGYILF